MAGIQVVKKSPDNVFLATSEGSINSFQLEAFEIEGKEAVCIKEKSGELKFRIIGKGGRAMIVQAES